MSKSVVVSIAIFLSLSERPAAQIGIAWTRLNDWGYSSTPHRQSDCMDVDRILLSDIALRNQEGRGPDVLVHPPRLRGFP